MISYFKEKIVLDSKDDVIKLDLLIKSHIKGINLSKSEIDTLYELYKVGYNEEFYNNCLNKGYFKSKQTIRNCVTRLTKLGILSYKKRGEKQVSEEFIPKNLENELIFNYLVGNLNGNKD